MGFERLPGWLHVNIYGTQTLHVCHTWPYMPISWGGLGGQWGGIYGSPMGRVWGITPGSPGSSLVTGSRTIRRDPLRSRSRSFGHPSAETHPPAVYRAIFNQECSFFSTHVRKHRSTARNRAFSIYIDYISPPKKDLVSVDRLNLDSVFSVRLIRKEVPPSGSSCLVADWNSPETEPKSSELL